MCLNVIGKVFAGDAGRIKVSAGQAVRIMTGAPIPADCDAVIRQEDTDYGETIVEVRKPLKSYQNYCYIGEDYTSGQLLVEKGSILSPEHIGIISSTGRGTIQVKKRLRVGVLSTGDELMSPGETLKPGKIYNSNLFFMLVARLQELGCEPIILQDHGDNTPLTVNEIKQNIDEIDVLVTTGAVSVGIKDIMHEVVDLLNAEVLFWKVNLKPGTPVLASLYKGKLLLSLSGNPTAAAVTFELLFADMLSTLLDCQELEFERRTAVVVGGYSKKKSY